MTTIATSQIRKLRDDLPREDYVAALCAGLKPGQLYWLLGSRPSSLGGFLVTLCETYEHAGRLSPKGTPIENIPSRYLEVVNAWYESLNDNVNVDVVAGGECPGRVHWLGRW